MHSPSLQLYPVSLTHYCVSGDVTIHEGAAIAPGVLLQADPDSRIVIGVGVCLGIGTVIHASGGTIEIRDGASLGAGVLVVGTGVIGDRACIGATTTLYNQSVESNAMIASGSLLTEEAISAEHNSEATEPDPTQAEPEATTEEIPESQPEATSPQPNSPEENLPEESDEIDSPSAPESPAKNGRVYGQSYVNQMLGRLFPHQQNSNGSDYG